MEPTFGNTTLKMDQLALLNAVLTVLGGWVTPKRAIQAIDLSVVIMIAAALGLSDALTASGVAGSFPKALRESNASVTGA
jgi:di/tricarboxylate transporter